MLLTVASSEANSALTRVAGTATQTRSPIETQVVEAVVGGNVTCLACESSSTVAHKAIQFVQTLMAMTRVWLAVVGGCNMDSYKRLAS